MGKGHLRWLILFCTLSGAAAPAWAQTVCAFCNESVRFDEALAACFETELPRQLAQGPASMEFAVINLAACGDDLRTRSGLPVELPEGQETVLLDASFVVPHSKLECLGYAVSARAKPLKEPQLYVFSDICP